MKFKSKIITAMSIFALPLFGAVACTNTSQNASTYVEDTRVYPNSFLALDNAIASWDDSSFTFLLGNVDNSLASSVNAFDLALQIGAKMGLSDEQILYLRPSDFTVKADDAEGKIEVSVANHGPTRVFTVDGFVKKMDTRNLSYNQLSQTPINGQRYFVDDFLELSKYLELIDNAQENDNNREIKRLFSELSNAIYRGQKEKIIEAITNINDADIIINTDDFDAQGKLSGQKFPVRIDLFYIDSRDKEAFFGTNVTSAEKMSELVNNVYVDSIPYVVSTAFALTSQNIFFANLASPYHDQVGKYLYQVSDSLFKNTLLKTLDQEEINDVDLNALDDEVILQAINDAAFAQSISGFYDLSNRNPLYGSRTGQSPYLIDPHPLHYSQRNVQLSDLVIRKDLMAKKLEVLVNNHGISKKLVVEEFGI